MDYSILDRSIEELKKRIKELEYFESEVYNRNYSLNQQIWEDYQDE